MKHRRRHAKGKPVKRQEGPPTPRLDAKLAGLTDRLRTGWPVLFEENGHDAEEAALAVALQAGRPDPDLARELRSLYMMAIDGAADERARVALESFHLAHADSLTAPSDPAYTIALEGFTYLCPGGLSDTAQQLAEGIKQ